MNFLRNPYFKIFAFSCFISCTLSCDEDYTEIGTDVINNQNISIDNQSYPVKTYNKRINPFQSNNLPGNLLGYYYDPNFGGTTAHFLSQITPQNFNPSFGNNPVLDSVFLSIPYFSKTDGQSYTLDSLYGNGPIKLSVFKNNFFLRNFDPGSDLDDFQAYYSNGALSVSEGLNSAVLEAQLLYTSDAFIPSNEPIDLTETNLDGEEEVIETLAPSLRIRLDDPGILPQDFWETLIFEKEDGDELSSASNFYNYFRGLYFKVEAVNSNTGSMVQLNFSSANAHVKLHYSFESDPDENGESTINQGVYQLNFLGNRTTLFENNFNTGFLQAIDSADEIQGDEHLYLKGGEGSMAIVELFSEDQSGNDFDDFITDFREIINEGQSNEERIIKRLINEAFLEFYIDESSSNTNDDFPNRIYIYDLENNAPLIDYNQDTSVNTSTSNSKLTHLVPLSVETDDQGISYKKYKVRLTSHINNIIVNDATNLRLGIVVSSNVGAATNQKLLNYDPIVKGIPTGSILSPKGVILHGSNSIDPLKKVRLNIYYSQAND
ncbi:MAG: DUF4270 domain-containing protein [Flavobacteriaceae bacterium]